MNISYTKKGDYLLPDLILEDKERFSIGKYGLLRLNYIKKYKLGLYFDLLVNDKLNEYLHNIDTTVMEMVQKLIKELAEKENITEELKDSNQMLWIGKMNNINSVIDIFNWRCDISRFIPKIKEILRIKYNLIIVKDSPMILKKYY